MTAKDYTHLAALAARLVTKYGRAVTFVQLNTTKTDAAKPWRGNTNPRATPAATLNVAAAFVGPTSLGFKTTVSDLLKNSEQICIVGTTSDLSIFQEIIDTDSSRWKIDNFEKLAPAGTTIMYLVGVSR